MLSMLFVKLHSTRSVKGKVYGVRTFPGSFMDKYKVNGKILQAKATLQSLIDNYSFDDDVMKEAKEKLQIIIDQETQNSNLKLPDNNLQILQFDK